MEVPMTPVAPAQQSDLHRKLNAVLHTGWNPLRLSKLPPPPNTDHQFLADIYPLAVAGNRDGIADYLFCASTAVSGLTTQKGQHYWLTDQILVEFK